MFDMRFRLREVMAQRGIETAYALAQRSNGAMNSTTAHRLVRAADSLKRIDLATLDVLCDVLKVEPGDLLERDKPKRR